ncbi:TPA: hypothetical protein QDB07_000825 [Burkholderia vietnamiensis]|nr:hypothetical protein [Burkholderia vietnamiensis]
MTDYSGGTGTLVLKTITPVITALFSTFDVEPSGDGTAYITWGRGDDAPKGLWEHVVTGLEALAKDLGLSNTTDRNGVPSVFGALLDHFHVDAAMRDKVLRVAPSDEDQILCGEPQFDELLVLANAFDDGHGLVSIAFDCASWADRPWDGYFYGTGNFVSGSFSFWTNTTNELQWAGKLSNAIASQKHDAATTLLAGKVKDLLSGITSETVRTTITKDLIAALQSA